MRDLCWSSRPGILTRGRRQQFVFRMEVSGPAADPPRAFRPPSVFPSTERALKCTPQPGKPPKTRTSPGYDEGNASPYRPA